MAGCLAGGLFVGPELEAQIEAVDASFKRPAEREVRPAWDGGRPTRRLFRDFHAR
jgi:hypothetical protein